MTYPKHPQTELIAQLYEQGVKISELAGQCGCAESTVARIANLRELPLRTAPKGAVKAAVVAGMRAGKTHAEIASEHGFNRESVSYAARRLGF